MVSLDWGGRQSSENWGPWRWLSPWPHCPFRLVPVSTLLLVVLVTGIPAATAAQNLVRRKRGRRSQGSPESLKSACMQLLLLSPTWVDIGLAWWLSGKESASQCWRSRFDPWVGKIPCRRRWQPTIVFLPGEFHGQRSLAGYSPWGHKESNTT